MLIPALLLLTVQTRTISVYGDEYVGRLMANGKPFSHDLKICASNDWPLGTKLKVTHNGVTIVLEVSDRMAKRFSKKRLDVGRDVFRKFEKKPDGLHKGARVEVVK